jgi:class 3 adenylate cyclase/tetratricopeptide (TPR) repeat protein
MNPARARFCMACAGPLPPESIPSSESRKTLTVLFCDVVGSTPLAEQLEPESIRRVMTRFFEEMRAALERHEGSVQKYIGDAVMAVFGVPVLHEDDALRAVRAAAEMQEALGELNAELESAWGVALQTRIGINTGEVVVGDAGEGGALVVGDAVNVAARLEQTAGPGEIVLGPDTYALVRGSVTVEEGRPLSLKGKAATITGYRLIDVRPSLEAPQRDTPAFVGRDDELDALRRAFDRSVDEGSCLLMTVLGAAGVGKSRLANEFAERVSQDARVLRGRCLPYGDGITFWPVAEMVKDVCGIAGRDSLQEARAKVVQLLSGQDDADLVAERVLAVSGLAETSAGMQEMFWAIRRFLETLQAARPVVVLFDDIQWAEPTFLDLVEYLAGWSRDARILILCLARPDLLDLRPGWVGLATTAGTLTLSPLNEDESRELIGNLLGASSLSPADAARIVDAAGGNPLFVEEMLRMLEDEGVLSRDDDRWHVVGDLAQVSLPASIHALLAARLDRLSAQEKAVLGTAAVLGKEFWWGAVSDLAPEHLRAQAGSYLQTLVRKGLILPERSTLIGEDAFRFHHILIQEAAYQGLSKERRADVHERFADWIEARSGERVIEYEEVVAYHLQQAYRYRLELGPPDDHTAALGVRAAERLSSAGRRALARRDVATAATLLERASSLYVPGDRARLALLPDLGEALMETGDLAGADRVLSEAIDGAEALGDRGLKGHAAVVRLMLMESTDPKGLSEVALRQLEGTIPVFEELGDDRGLARTWRLKADVQWTQARYAAADEALERAIGHARRAKAVGEEADSLGLYTGAAVYGPMPVPEAVERCERILNEASGERLVLAGAARSLAALRAMQGRFDEARELATRATDILQDLGLWLRAAYVSEALGFVERLAGDAAAAERALQAGYDVADKLGEQGYLSTAATLLAHAVLDQGRLDDADGFIVLGEEAGAEDDLTTQVLVRSARGRVLAARGRPQEAERQVREATALAELTDDLNMRGDVLMDLAEVVGIGGDRQEMASVLDQALALYEAKGNIVMAAEARRRATAPP